MLKGDLNLRMIQLNSQYKNTLFFQMGDVLEELHKAREVFIEKATEQARHMAWVMAVIYSKVSP